MCLDIDYKNTYGLTYDEAYERISIIDALLQERKGKVFSTFEECSTFASDCHIGTLAYSPAKASFLHVSHKGDLLSTREWKTMYCLEILKWRSIDREGNVKVHMWSPPPFDSRNNAKIIGERGDGRRLPLFHRDYFTPSGTYDPSTCTYNNARPFPVFAKETGADTSHIHELLRRVCGECYPYFLAWLRKKMVYPTKKTEVIPIFISRTQGTGKTTVGEIICRALFGQDNVIVSHQVDVSSRFNADQSDALIIAYEEKSEHDKKNTEGALKSSATATQVRKEKKGVDPYYQDSHTDYIMSTNELVPILFTEYEQRRYMIMQADETFTRKPATGQPYTETNRLADEVFTKLYGYDADGNKICEGLLTSPEQVMQLKHELYTMKGFERVELKNFPKTEAYNNCYVIPQNNDKVSLESLLRGLAPFIKMSLITGSIVNEVLDNGEKVFLDAYTDPLSLVYRKKGGVRQRSCVSINRMLAFKDRHGEPLPHSIVSRNLERMKDFFLNEYELVVITQDSVMGNGFPGVRGPARHSPISSFYLAERDHVPIATNPKKMETMQVIKAKSLETGVAPKVSGERRHRFNSAFLPDPNGEFETLNPLLPGSTRRLSSTVSRMDYFLLESDNASAVTLEMEKRRLEAARLSDKRIDAETLYSDRLAPQRSLLDRLFKEGSVCRVVYSGGKSLHAIIRVEDEPKNKEERKWLASYINMKLSTQDVVFDPSTWDPSRLTRYPTGRTRTSKYKDDKNDRYDDVSITGEQKLIHENGENVYRINWRPVYGVWKNAPKDPVYEAKGRMLPSKPLYREAAKALMDDTFWTDEKWDGQRNMVFWMGYRLIRSQGYSHDEVWEGLSVGILKYKKPNEISYWQSRKDCSLIKEIDEDFDE